MYIGCFAEFESASDCTGLAASPVRGAGRAAKIEAAIRIAPFRISAAICYALRRFGLMGILNCNAKASQGYFRTSSSANHFVVAVLELRLDI